MVGVNIIGLYSCDRIKDHSTLMQHLIVALEDCFSHMRQASKNSWTRVFGGFKWDPSGVPLAVMLCGNLVGMLQVLRARTSWPS